MNRKASLVVASLSSIVAMLVACQKQDIAELQPPIENTNSQSTMEAANGLKEQLGRRIYFDKNLSNPIGQSCSSCHDPAAAFSDPNHTITSAGAVDGLFGNRNSPTSSYSMFVPALHFDKDDEVYEGGMFWDGRVNSLEEQAQKPLLNPVEMNNSSISMVVKKIKAADYYPLFVQVYGDVADDKSIFEKVGDAVASFERTPEVNPFTSKFDYYLKGQVHLTQQELHGLQLFNDPSKGNCAACHPSTPDSESGKVLFTDFTYDNIGVPKNPDNPFYNLPKKYNAQGAGYIDHGLGDIVHDKAYDGFFRVSSLRNVAVSFPYFHNGYFKTLEEVVHFYNARDTDHFPAAEVPKTVNHDELGNLGLTQQEERDIVAFLKTLTDGYK